MGSFASKRESGLLDGGDDQSQFLSSPPVTAVPSRHFLPRELDPRSPSAGIDRTPIPVSAPQETVEDPRSPSVGIMRTPIVCVPTESGQCYLFLITFICQFLLINKILTVLNFKFLMRHIQEFCLTVLCTHKH